MDKTQALKEEDADVSYVKYYACDGEDFFSHYPDFGDLEDVEGGSLGDMLDDNRVAVVEVADDNAIKALFGEPQRSDVERMAVWSDSVVWSAYPKHCNVKEEAESVPRCAFEEALKAANVPV